MAKLYLLSSDVFPDVDPAKLKKGVLIMNIPFLDFYQDITNDHLELYLLYLNHMNTNYRIKHKHTNIWRTKGILC